MGHLLFKAFLLAAPYIGIHPRNLDLDVGWPDAGFKPM